MREEQERKKKRQQGFQLPRLQVTVRTTTIRPKDQKNIDTISGKPVKRADKDKVLVGWSVLE
jgi:hypothetical protein